LAQSVRLRVDQGVATQAGNIFGSVLLIKQGPGILRLERMAATPAAARIEAGTLEVNSLFGGTMQVLNNAQLAGVGAVANVQTLAGATLTPGPATAAAGSAQAIGELTVTGNLHMEANSALHADVLPDGRSDHLRVIGQATVNGHVLARALDGPWQPETRYTLMSADGGLNGRFAAANSNLPFLQPSLSYDARHAYLTLTRNTTPLDSVVDEPGENDIGDAVEDLTDDTTAPIRDAVITQDRQGAHQLLSALSGSWIPSVASRLMEDSRYIRNTALRRMGRHKEPATGLWASTYGTVAKRNDDGSIAPDKRTLAGVAMGRIVVLGNGARTSLFAGYEHSTMDQSGTRTTTQANSLHAGVAVAGQTGWLDVSLGLIRSWHRLQGQREILSQRLKQWLNNRYRMQALQVFGEAAVPLTANTGEASRSGLRLQGFSRLAWVHMKAPEHQEHRGTAALSFETQRMRTLFSELGLRARYTWRRANRVNRVHAELAWHHAAGTLVARTQARFAQAQAQRRFTVEGQAIARNALDLNLTLETVVGRRMRAALAYTGRVAKGNRDHGATLDMTWAF
jgi:outer membrane autotransporter protein